MRNCLLYFIAASLLLFASCVTKEQVRTNQQSPVTAPSQQTNVSWSADPTEFTDNDALKQAWRNFEASHQYRLAQSSHRNLSPAARERVNSNSVNQIIPSLIWWGAKGYRGTANKDFLVAIVVDSSRSDPNRYGLIVLAAPRSEGPSYKTYWVLREEDMESYLISPASGSVYMECFRRDGSQQTKEITWERKLRQFRLV
jgi:hypothetical protein